MLPEEILNDRINTHLLIIPGKSNEVVIGVPHHSPLGVPQLPCREHPDADENAGFAGLHVAHLLDCTCVIACNYFIDVNKNGNTDYFQKIRSIRPKILVEIHGHGGRTSHFDIEISSGSPERNHWSMKMAEGLAARISGSPTLGGYSLSGDYNRIYFKAKKSISITTNEWIAFHIELPGSIRASELEYLPFCKALAETTRDLLANIDGFSRDRTTN